MIDMVTPKIDWIKNDPEKHKYFESGSVFLVALQVHTKEKTSWEFDVVQVNCDGDWFCLEYRGGETYDAWEWSDFEYFHLLEGSLPCEEIYE